MLSDCATIYIDHTSATCATLRGYFAEIFAALDECPRILFVTVHGASLCKPPFIIDFEEGEPIFRREGSRSARANFRNRYLPEHPVPFRFSKKCPTYFLFIPAGSNRIKVRQVGAFRALIRRALQTIYNSPLNRWKV